eukprot:591328-Pelagomonas_calceolata.AAC.1
MRHPGHNCSGACSPQFTRPTQDEAARPQLLALRVQPPIHSKKNSLSQAPPNKHGHGRLASKSCARASGTQKGEAAAMSPSLRVAPAVLAAILPAALPLTVPPLHWFGSSGCRGCCCCRF